MIFYLHSSSIINEYGIDNKYSYYGYSKIKYYYVNI